MLVKKDFSGLYITNDDLVFETAKEAKLGIIKLLRKEYGDTFNLGSDYVCPHFDLKLMESYIYNDSSMLLESSLKNLLW